MHESILAKKWVEWMNVDLNMFKKIPSLFLVRTSSKNLKMAWTNSKDEKLAK